MPIRTAKAEWSGDFKTGQGTIMPRDGDFTAHFTFASIFTDAPGTNPMEMLGASVAGCYTGALAALLSRTGCSPTRILTNAEVHVSPISEGYNITRIHLHAQAEAPGMDTARFTEIADEAKRTCPVAQALGSVEITLHAEIL